MRKIAVITGTRAEYGLLSPLIHEIQNDPFFQLQFIVTGQHLSPEFGSTYQLIEQDGFRIDEKVEMLLSGDTASSVAKSVGLGVLGFSDALQRLKPDIIVILGDRFEMLSAAQSAFFLRIPIVHIHGGELSSGALDDSIRHCITKMSHLHFTATEIYRKRVIQLGENPTWVFNVGALGVERIQKMKPIKKEVLEKNLHFHFGKQTFLFTYHPETTDLNNINNDIKNILLALDAFPTVSILMTKSNSDEAGRFINQALQRYADQHNPRVKLFSSLGDLNYLSVLRQVDVVIGNSSSGIIEASALKVPTVNIGSRQDGRLCASSVINCSTHTFSIVNSIKKALSDDFKRALKNMTSPYDGENTAAEIKRILKTVELNGLVKKELYSIPGL